MLCAGMGKQMTRRALMPKRGEELHYFEQRPEGGAYLPLLLQRSHGLGLTGRWGSVPLLNGRSVDGRTKEGPLGWGPLGDSLPVCVGRRHLAGYVEVVFMELGCKEHSELANAVSELCHAVRITKQYDLTRT